MSKILRGWLHPWKYGLDSLNYAIGVIIGIVVIYLNVIPSKHYALKKKFKNENKLII